MVVKPKEALMYALAHKCNACGFTSKSPGTHCNAPMVAVIVMENVWPESTPQPTIIREVVREIKEIQKENEKPEHRYNRFE